MTRKLRLTDLDLVLLSHAVNRPDGMLLPPPENVRARGKTLEKALAKLLRLHLVEETLALAPGQAWRHHGDGHGIALRIAAAGRAALGLDDGSHVPGEGATRQDAAEDTAGTAGIAGTAEATENINPATPPGAAPFAPGVKPGTKQARLVDYLSRPWGATIDDLRQLLGWQPHTVRAALTGLRKKGYRVTGGKNDNGVTAYRAAPPAKATEDAA